jgi:hypothetical protein
MVMRYEAALYVEPGIGSPKRDKKRAGVVVVVKRTPKMTWVTKPIIVRSLPFTAIEPTERQAGMRALFGGVAKKARGMRGKKPLPRDGKKLPAGTLVPPACFVVQSDLKDKAAKALDNLGLGRTITYDAEAKRYRTYTLYRIRSAEEHAARIGKTIEDILRALPVAVAAAPAAVPAVR